MARQRVARLHPVADPHLAVGAVRPTFGSTWAPRPRRRARRRRRTRTDRDDQLLPAGQPCPRGQPVGLRDVGGARPVAAARPCRGLAARHHVRRGRHALLRRQGVQALVDSVRACPPGTSDVEGAVGRAWPAAAAPDSAAAPVERRPRTPRSRAGPRRRSTRTLSASRQRLGSDVEAVLRRGPWPPRSRRGSSARSSSSPAGRPACRRSSQKSFGP